MTQSNRQKAGREGEDIACDYLQRHGYSIFERNVATKYGEIDVIAQKGRKLFFVEIKYRKNSEYGRALDAVTTTKQNRIRSSAQIILNRMPSLRSFVPYFSVIAIDERTQSGLKIEFLPDAFW